METKLFNTCLRCGRKLKNPVYRKLGYGKVCWEKSQRDTTVRQMLFQVVNYVKKEGDNSE